MNINIYTKYHVEETIEYCCLDEENEMITRREIKNVMLNGNDFLFEINLSLQNMWLSSMYTNESEITIESFNPQNGETCLYKWKIISQEPNPVEEPYDENF